MKSVRTNSADPKPRSRIATSAAALREGVDAGQRCLGLTAKLWGKGSQTRYLETRKAPVGWRRFLRACLPSLLVLLTFQTVPPATAQAIRTFTLGRSASAWQNAGGGIEPLVVGGTLFRPVIDTTNTPGNAVDFSTKPGWITPLHFDAEVNVASRVLDDGKITAPNAVEEKAVVNAQLEGVVNGDHNIAFERKPTAILPLNPFGIWVILDFANPIGVHRVRFYPRNTVVENSRAPYHNDFMHAFELWTNKAQTSAQRSPDVLALRRTSNEEAVVDLSIAPKYTRLIKIKSLTEVPWEIDEVEVYATGYLQRATYLSDLIDLEDRATLGQVRWRENVVGNPIRSEVSTRMRTGTDATPLVFQQKILDSLGIWQGQLEVVDGPTYVNVLRRSQRGPVEDDFENWSPWKAVENSELITAPGQRRYIQLQIDFAGDLFDTREVNSISFDYLQPPLADTLRAEVWPRLTPAEQRATFRYAILLRSTGPIRGFDRLEVDANALVEDIRNLTVNSEPTPFDIDYIRRDGFGLSFPLIRQDSTLVEFTFDLPIFRFGTTFSSRAYNAAAGDLPQRLEAGNAATMGPGDLAELSNLSVAIPRAQVGKLVGEIVVSRPLFTPNGDGVNDQFELFFNLLQLTRATPVVLEIYDLAGRQIHTVFREERIIGPSLQQWDGRLADGTTVPPGHYIWVLSVEADAFEERHSGLLGVVY